MLESRKVLGLCGYPGSGKDAAAKVLVEERGFTRVSFADPIRQCLLILNPIVVFAGYNAVRLADIVINGDWSAAKQLPEVRRLLQVFGTDVVRELLSENTWINLAKNRICNDNLQKVVITDVRFQNEVKLVHNFYQGMILKIHRPGVGPINDHTSEYQEISFNDIIYNSSDLAHLRTRILEYVDVWLAT